MDPHRTTDHRMTEHRTIIDHRTTDHLMEDHRMTNHRMTDHLMSADHQNYNYPNHFAAVAATAASNLLVIFKLNYVLQLQSIRIFCFISNMQLTEILFYFTCMSFALVMEIHVQ